MSHRVLVTAEAQQDIEAAYLFIRADAPEAARRWRQNLLKSIRTLTLSPNRHEIAAEGREVGVELRQMLFGNYRVLYTGQSDEVHVHAVRHGARRPFRPDELPGSEEEPQ